MQVDGLSSNSTPRLSVGDVAASFLRFYWSVMLVIGGPIAVCEGQVDGLENHLAVAQFVAAETEDAITLKRGERKVLVYHKAIQEPPEGMDPVYRRSGYIHPICTPSGLEVTGDFAPGHVHQHGFFLAWVNTRYEGRALDFWNQKKQTGQVTHSQVLAVQNGKQAAFEVKLFHQDIRRPEKPETILVDRWRVEAAGGTDDYFAIDIQSEQTNITKSPLELLEYHYGGLGIRGNDQWYARKTAQAAVKKWTKNQSDGNNSSPPGIEVMGHEMLTSEGKHKQDGNHTPARWAAMFGQLDGQPAGIAILSHPENFRSPQPVRLHPVEPYFSYAPVVTGPFKIQPAATYRARYRVIAFDGPIDPQMLDREWDAFSK